MFKPGHMTLILNVNTAIDTVPPQTVQIIMKAQREFLSPRCSFLEP